MMASNNDAQRPIHRLIPSSVQSSQRATSQPPRPIGQPAQRQQYGISLSPPPIQPGSRSSSFSSYAGLGRRAFSPGRGVEEEVEFLDYDEDDFVRDSHQLSNSMNDEQFARGRFLQGGGGGINSRSQSLMAGGVGISGRRMSSTGAGYPGPENASPFVRDVGSILLDDSSAFRELLPQGAYYGQDGGYSQVNGTASRRHSVSTVGPLQRPHLGTSHPSRPSSFTPQLHHHSPSSYSRGVPTGAYPAAQVHNRMTGFDAPENMTPTHMPNTPRNALGGHGGGLGLSDDDLADDLASLNLNGHHNGAYESRGLSVSPRQRVEYAPLHISTTETHQPSSYGRSPISPGITRSYSSSSNGPPPIQRQPSYPQQYRQQSAPHQHLDIPPDNQLGRGIPLATLPPSYRLYIVEFKAGRTDLFYWRPGSDQEDPRLESLVLVEGDRGRDLGKVVNDHITREQVEEWLLHENAPMSPGGMSNERKEINPKMILYTMGEMRIGEDLRRKGEDEGKALGLCKQKVSAKRLPMEVVDAEYQWDRKKLTFYFVSDKRIDFRELVRELFRLYKTRIWMAALQAPAIPSNLAPTGTPVPHHAQSHSQGYADDDHRPQPPLPQPQHARNGSGVQV